MKAPDQAARARAEAQARFGECVVDATSIRGLGRIQRERPGTWHEILREGVQGRRKIGLRTTVGGALRRGLFGYLQATAPRQRHLRKRRASARRVAEAVAAWFEARGEPEPPVTKLDEAWLRSFCAAYGEWAKERLCNELIRRDQALLRLVLWRTQRALGMQPQVRRRGPRSRKRIGRKVTRTTATPELLATLLAYTSCPVKRLVFALPAACGLLESEILPLVPADFDMAACRVHVHGGSVRGRPGIEKDRWVAMPPWLVELVWQAFPTIAAMQPDALLFPHRSHPRRHRTSFSRDLARACERAGIERLTFGALRRLYGVVARENGAPRGLVRGSVGEGEPARRLEREREVVAEASEALARRWRVLVMPPGVWEGTRWHLPRKAPKGVGVLEAEIRRDGAGRTGALVRALPGSCRGSGWEVEDARRRREEDAPWVVAVQRGRGPPQGAVEAREGVIEPIVARDPDGVPLVRQDSLLVAGMLGLGLGVLGRGIWEEWQRGEG